MSKIVIALLSFILGGSIGIILMGCFLANKGSDNDEK